MTGDWLLFEAITAEVCSIGHPFRYNQDLYYQWERISNSISSDHSWLQHSQEKTRLWRAQAMHTNFSIMKSFLETTSRQIQTLIRVMSSHGGNWLPLEQNMTSNRTQWESKQSIFWKYEPWPWLHELSYFLRCGPRCNYAIHPKMIGIHCSQQRHRCNCQHTILHNDTELTKKGQATCIKKSTWDVCTTEPM